MIYKTMTRTCWVAALLTLSACASYPRTGDHRQNTSALPTSAAGLLTELDRDLDNVENDIRRQNAGLREFQTLTHTREVLRAIKSADVESGNKELRDQYCDAMLGILTDVETELGRARWTAARASFARIRKLENGLISELGLTADERVRVWLKSAF